MRVIFDFVVQFWLAIKKTTRNTCMQQPLALLIKNAAIFGEHEVFVDYSHSNTAIYIFFKKV